MGLPSSCHSIALAATLLSLLFLSICASTPGQHTRTISSFVLVSQTNVTCPGGSDGSATVSATGTLSPYSYTWTNGGEGDTQTNLSAATYTATAFNDADTGTLSVVISQPDPLTASFTNVINPTCYGSATASALVTANGGTAGYTYVWSTGATSRNISGLTLGAYTVEITDARGCQVNSKFKIGYQPAIINITATVHNVSTHNGADGTISISVSGGVTPYTYMWDDSTTSTSLTSLAVGTYTITVTDYHNCTMTKHITISQPSDISVGIVSQTNPSCHSAADGSATVNATGGVPPYHYLWPGGSTSPSISGLMGGTYTVTVTDATAASTEQAIIITAPDALVITVASTTNEMCPGGQTGSATVSVSGGTSPYTYAWVGGGASATLNNLAAGSYSLTVTDAHMCTQQTTAGQITITEPSFTITGATPTNVLCMGASTGALSVQIAGGAMPYTYSWSNGGVGASIANVTAGTYSVNITDNNGCFLSGSYTITEPATGLQLVAASATNETCHGSDGTAQVTVSGGVTPYIYTWSNGGSTGASQSSLTAGSYSVVVADQNQCAVKQTFSVGISGILIAPVTVTQVSCYGLSNGALAVAPTGGNGPYSYSWTNGGTTAAINNLPTGSYTVTVTDSVQCAKTMQFTITQPNGMDISVSSTTSLVCHGGANSAATATVVGGTAPYTYLWSNGGKSAYQTGLSAGNYSVTVTDANGCYQKTPDHVIPAPPPVYVNVATVSPLCHGGYGSATATVIGGAPGFSYDWSSGGDGADVAWQLVAGDYSLVVTDANMCMYTQTFTITEPSAVSLAVTPSTTCSYKYGASAAAVASGGTPGYTYKYLPSGGAGANASGLAPGGHYVTVTDAHGCSLNQAFTIAAPVVEGFKFASNQVDVLCFGARTGSASLSPMAGSNGNYSYTWSNGATTPAITGLSAGTQNVTVTDSCGDTQTTSFSIAQPVAPLNLTAYTNISCASASAAVIATGGAGGYTYAWSHSVQITPSIPNLSTGSYTVTVTDANGCSMMHTFAIKALDCGGTNEEEASGKTSSNSRKIGVGVGVGLGVPVAVGAAALIVFGIRKRTIRRDANTA